MMEKEEALKLIMNAALEAAMPRGKFNYIPEPPKGNLILLGARQSCCEYGC